MSQRESDHLTLSKPDGLPETGQHGPSHIAVVAPNSRLIFIGAQDGENAHGELPADFHLQVRWALANLKIAVNAAGAELTDIARLGALIMDHSEERLTILHDEIAEAWQGEPAPVCTVIPVPRLGRDDRLVEIDATAVTERTPNEH